MKCITFTFSGAGIQSWTFDRAVRLDGVAGNTGNWAVSANPTMVTTDLSAAGGNSIRQDVYYWSSSNASRQFPIQLNPGETVFVAASAACSVTLYYT